jgi:hypothetical protein
VICGEYEGSYLGKFNTYAHQATGDVYAIDEYTFLIKNFFYDGLGEGIYSKTYLKHVDKWFLKTYLLK